MFLETGTIPVCFLYILKLYGEHFMADDKLYHQENLAHASTLNDELIVVIHSCILFCITLYL